MKPFHPSVQRQTVLVDCYGRRCRDEVAVSIGNTSFRFIWDSRLKKGNQFHLALFQDRSAVHRSVFRYPYSRRIAVLTESPIEPYFNEFHRFESRFPIVLTHDAKLLERGSRYTKFFYGTSFISGAEPPRRKDKMCSFMGSIQHGNEAGYRLRREVAMQLINDERIDCFGRGIQEVETKEIALSPYRFSVAMENTRRDYYFTEKIIDCFLVHTVPIYWGSESITDVFDKRGMIRFGTNNELSRILDSLTENRYEEMLPFILRNKETAMKLKLASYEQMHERFAHALDSNNVPDRAASSVITSRGAAAFRMLASGTIG